MIQSLPNADTFKHVISASLQSLRETVNGKLEVVYCDFFKMDPRNSGIVKPPIMISETLFRHFGIKAVPWSEGNFCHSLQQIAYNLPAFSSRTLCRLKRSTSCLDDRVFGRVLSGDCGFSLT